MGKELLGSLELNRIYLIDAIEGMKLIPDESIDMVLCDLPYGTTACSWDSIIPLDKLWEQYERIIKTKGAIVLFGSEPFSSSLRMSKLDLYKYDWIWEKGRASGFVHAKNKPLKAHETISIFSKGTTVHASQSKNRMHYFPQMEEGKPYKKTITQVNTGKLNHEPSKSNQEFVGTVNENKGTRYPRSVLKYSMHNVGNIHPTQKPVELCEYLIRTYTEEGNVVLDNCMGSGTTAVAAILSNRKWIGFETEREYYELANKRLESIELDADLSKL
ncbi:DNA-methyltransferase [Robertmurraya siralis]|uniref:DNA-methyltransferase n=1 Tax=Robertmurraya siralis TaxID=77777 RepID=UPI0010F9BEA1|nr:site-specific DNA-methyltransferase [Robertmurraya siralis]